jgi:hypothetical protein
MGAAAEGMSRPTVPAAPSVNHTLPSGPAVIPFGRLSCSTRYAVIVPLGVIRAILAAAASVNQTLPSRPAAIPLALLPDLVPPTVWFGIGNSLIVPLGVIRPILLATPTVKNQRL